MTFASLRSKFFFNLVESFIKFRFIHTCCNTGSIKIEVLPTVHVFQSVIFKLDMKNKFTIVD